MSGQRLMVIALCSLGIVSCSSTMQSSREYSYETSGGLYDAYTPPYYSTQSYSYYNDANSADPYTSQGEGVSVPESYHVGASHSPVPAKDRDRTWVKEQNPNGYTIELGDSEKASQVAKKLYQAPKKERMAEVPYIRNGGQHYKGLYGSFPTEEAAKKALDSLPDSIKGEAGVKSWGAVQGSVGE